MAKGNRKQAVSIRMSKSDVSRVKLLAQRLGVRDSDIFRYAIKTTLLKLSPLYDPQVRGRNLIPVFVESGTDLFHHFDLDAGRLEGIINQDVDEAGRVAHDDIQRIATSAVRQPFHPWPGSKSGPETPFKVLGRPDDEARSAVSVTKADAGQPAATSLQLYLYEKYAFRRAED
jgi:hypothetical protein